MSLSRAQILAEIAANLPDNTSAGVTPAILRTTLGDVSSTVLAGATVIVDAALGSDATGATHDLALPFKTLDAALTAAASGDLIFVRSGTYTPSANLAKNGVAWYFAQGAKVTFAPANPSHALWDLIAASSTYLNIDGHGEFTCSPTGSAASGFGSLVNAGNADASTSVTLSSPGVFRCHSLLDTTGTMLSFCYNSTTVGNLTFTVEYMTASISVHGLPVVNIGTWNMTYGKIGSDNCTISGTSRIAFFSDVTGLPANGLVVGDYLHIGYFFNGTLQAHACTINIGQTNVNNNQICQVWVTQGPTRIVGNLRTYNGPGQAAPLIIQSVDPVYYEGTIDMTTCDYSFPVDIKTNGAILKFERACLLQNLAGTGAATRTAIYGTATAYGMFCESGVSATVVYRNGIVSTAAISPGFSSVGPAITVNAAVT